jgi:hypothetical protein
MDTKRFGKCMWDTMFIIAMNYPLKINNSKEHVILKKHYYNYYTSYKYMLPCKYCRISYSQFIKSIPLKKHLNSRKRLILWLYKIKDLVNKKLIKQEQQQIDEINNSNKTNEEKIKDIEKIHITLPSPAFDKVYSYYEQYRAYCSDKKKTCIRKSTKVKKLESK